MTPEVMDSHHSSEDALLLALAKKSVDYRLGASERNALSAIRMDITVISYCFLMVAHQATATLDKSSPVKT